MRRLRTFLSIILLLLVVCAIAIGSFMLMVNPNQLKPVIITQMMNQTGYMVTMEGDLHWSFYPQLGVKVNHMTVREPNKTTPFLTLSGLRVATELKSLLSGIEKLNGYVYIEEVNLLNVHLTKVRAMLSWQNGVLAIQRLQGECYEGHLTGDVFGRSLSTLPAWNWTVQLNKVQLKSLLLDMNGPQNKLKLSGLADVVFQGTTQGKTRDDLFSNLNGTTQFLVTQGALEGVNLNYYIRTASALLQSQPIPTDDTANQTAFTTLSGSGVITHGLFSTKELYLVAPTFLARGTGTFQLADEEMNFNILVKPTIDFKWPWEVPLTITGNLHQPEVNLDKLEIQKLVASQHIQELKAKATEEVKKHVPGKAGDLLQKLLR